MALEMQPTITITCTQAPMPGSPGQVMLQPQISLTHLPGENALQAWGLTHKLLLQCAEIAVQQMLQAVQEQQRVAVVPMLPENFVRH